MDKKNLMFVGLCFLLCSCGVPTTQEQGKTATPQRIYIDKNPCNEVVNGKRLLKMSRHYSHIDNIMELQRELAKDQNCEIVDVRSYGVGTVTQYYVVYK